MATFQKRGTSWRAIVRKKGHPAQTHTFSTKARAQAWAKQVESELEDRAAGIKPGLTIGDALKRHEAHLERISSRGRKNKTSANNLRKGIDTEMLLSQLQYQHLMTFADTRRKVDGVAASTVMTDIMYLSGAITTCVVEELAPPALKASMSSWRAGLKRAGLIGNPDDRDRRPTDKEIEELLTHTRHNLALRRIGYNALIRFAVNSCMRLDEICSLRWEDLDATNGTIIVRLRKHPTKATDQVVPLMGESLAIIEAQPRKEERIFPFNSESTSNGFRRICQHLGIENLHFHDLRHEGISRLFERGYQIQEVAMVSGHRDWKSLKRYVNLRPGELVIKDRARSESA
ncbi:integrase [Kushneria pakistanensis]|uniref:Integrase n=1 Tax=Kushneria pakistanensis TaxID=1508770 RepID=A0ABQ3FC06_9GAMM|nr:site-specific integrase [Kushneria pakistanensis]GHC17386.1 integrase [Kushneria pakistanensis]